MVSAGEVNRKEPPSRDLLLVARDWQTRALTLAELKEAGYEVTAVPGLRFARTVLEEGRAEPPLVLLDVHDDPDATPAVVEELMGLGGEPPWILVVGRFEEAGWQSVTSRFTAVLRRPVSIGEIVTAVRRIVPPSSAQSSASK